MPVKFAPRTRTLEILVSGASWRTIPAQAVAKLSSRWLLDNVQDGQRLALSWGTALQAMVWSVTASRRYDLEVVQLVGAVNWSECVAKLGGNNLDAVTVDDLLLAGFAAQGGGRFVHGRRGRVVSSGRRRGLGS